MVVTAWFAPFRISKRNRVMKTKFILSILIITGLLQIGACVQNTKSESQISLKDTLEIWVDTSLAVLINEQRKAFENEYNTPFIQLHYAQESSIIKKLLSNELNCAVLQRNLSGEEARFLTSKEDFNPKQYIIAHDAFVFIANKECELEYMTPEHLSVYFTGKNLMKYQFVFESNNCQAIPYFKSYLHLNDAEMSKGFSKNGLQDLIDFISKDKNSIGIIPFSYISDIEAESTSEMLKNLKILSVKYTDSTNTELLVNPSQESITTKDYPYTMPIVLLNCNMEKKSGTNFVNYIFKPKAQRLFLRCGMVPAIFPGREVIINTN